MKDFIGPLGIIAVLVFVTAMVNPRIGLMLIVFSIILSPEFRVIDKPIRPEDILIMVVILAWIAIMATQGKNFVQTPLNAPIFIYLFINFLALVNALAFGNISPFTGNPQEISYSILTFFKKVEYFLVFFVVAHAVRTFKHVRLYVVLMCVACAISGAYALYAGTQEGFSEPVRVSAPFDTGESNTFGQYLMFNILIILSLYFAVKSSFQRLLLGALFMYSISAFTLTFSRGSYFALLIAVIFLGIMKERKILIGMILCLFFSTILFSQSVIHRVESGADEIEEWYQGSADPSGNAFVHRVNSFTQGFGVALKQPLLGAGIGVVPLERTEAQLPREALEAGFLGLFAFLWVMWAVAKLCWETINMTKNQYVHGLSYGMLAGLVGYTISGLSAIPFTTIRTAEPFWFLCGLVAACHQIILSEKELPEIRSFESTLPKTYKIHLPETRKV